MAKMTVFHGGYEPVEHPEIRKGRNTKDNDLFYTCSLIEYIARKTKNIRADVVNQLGKEQIEKIYELADVYHCDNIERVAEDFIAVARIKNGTFDNVGACRYIICPAGTSAKYINVLSKWYRKKMALTSSMH